MTARMAAAVDDLSEGRLRLGVGAGWMEREHRNYGWDLLTVPERMDRFEEGLEVITRLFHYIDEPVNFDGKYYHLEDATLLPRPRRPGGPPIVIGGNGPERTLPLVARYADEWNGVFLTPARYAERNALLDQLLEDEGRGPDQVRRTLMTNLVFGRDEAELERQLEGDSADELRQSGRVVGTPGEVIEQLNRLAEAGVQRVMLQWLELDDIDRLEALAKTVLPQV
jgi:alkanesulfonate monooxygenase SsuD/methylene tetrahydromethanopterin reductase-like flavin-dependent oxidoreductase (luciferase family)